MSFSSIMRTAGVLAVITPSVCAWPGKADIRLEDSVIYKTMLGPSHPKISIEAAFKLEVKALQRLEEARKKLQCDGGRRHFPAVISADVKKLELAMTYNGKPLEWVDDSNFHDVVSNCITPITKQDYMQQVDCMLAQFQEANVRNLDLFCPAGCNDGLPYQCGVMHFLKNIVMDKNGTISMIDFEYSTVDDKPDFLKDRICYKRSHRGDMKEYLASISESLKIKGWELAERRMCGPNFKADDPKKHTDHKGFGRTLAGYATNAMLGGVRAAPDHKNVMARKLKL